MKTSISTIVLLSVVASATLTAGGDKLSPRLVGMGRTFTAISRGLDAVGTNPANLALDDRNASFTLNLFPFGLSVGSDFINYKIYKDDFTGVPDPSDPNNRIAKNLTEQDKKDILGLFPGGIARTQAKFEMAPIGFSIHAGNFGFALVPSVQFATNLDLPEDYLKFPLNGLNYNNPKYVFDGTALNASVIGEINFSTGYLLPVTLPKVNELAVGIGLKYLVGIAYTGTDHYNATIQQSFRKYTDQTTGASDYLPSSGVSANFDFLQLVALDTVNNGPAGSGFGVDIGASAMVMNVVRVGLSITDIGSITWDKGTKAIYGRSNVTISDVGQAKGQDSLSTAFKGTTVDTTSFSYGLPTALHIGGEADMDDIFTAIPFRWKVAVDFHFGFNNAPGNSKTPQIALGTELDPLAGWLPLRTGILIGGREHFSWAAGFGLHLANTFDLDFATQSIALLTNPDSFRTGSFTLGMRLRF